MIFNLVIFCDGASKGNPGKASYGFVVYKLNSCLDIALPAGNQLDESSFLKIIDRLSLKTSQKLAGNKNLGQATNNQAEWQSLVASLTKCLDYKKDLQNLKALVFMDSQLVIRQISGQYRVKKPELIQHYQQTNKLLNNFENYRFFHIPRNLNQEADQMANLALV